MYYQWRELKRLWKSLWYPPQKTRILKGRSCWIKDTDSEKFLCNASEAYHKIREFLSIVPITDYCRHVGFPRVDDSGHQLITHFPLSFKNEQDKRNYAIIWSPDSVLGIKKPNINGAQENARPTFEEYFEAALNLAIREGRVAPKQE